ncbi:MAG TPA: T9SS type A sorting domain-containing protein [Candidatus Kapabacteria bacterium]|nr:T9SS type A sorting domain-containing protein [Candidatus Kapabacteria bacterium]
MGELLRTSRSFQCRQGHYVYGTGPNLKLVVSGHELFNGSIPNPYWTQFQRVWVARYDGAAVSGPATHDWRLNTFDIDNGASQSNHDVQILQNAGGDILLPLIVHCRNCIYAGFNQGEGKIYTISTAGVVQSSVSVGTVTAYDLKMRALPLSDGGFGIITTKQPHCPPAPYSCYVTDYWATDAYIARFGACGSLLWDQTIDVDNNPPAANYPGNVKRQECMYGISQAADGGFVVSGNNSFNFDDDYLIKLLPEPIQPAGLFMQDTPLDFGLEPNPDTGPMWISNDIWVRNGQDDALHSHAHQNQNPEYDATQTHPNYIYVQVRNNTCTAQTGTLNVYIAAASTGLGWPTDWTNNITCGSYLCLGELTSTLPTISLNIPAYGDSIVELPWYPPSPSNPACLGGHACILARVVPLTGSAEVTNINTNVNGNNKIVWKNEMIVDNLQVVQQDSIPMGIRAVGDGSHSIRLEFDAAGGGAPNIFDYFDITVLLDKDLGQAWKDGGQQSHNMTVVSSTVFNPTGTGAWIGNINLGEAEAHTIDLQFTAKNVASPPDGQLLVLDMKQLQDDELELVGGERFHVEHQRPVRREPAATGGQAAAAVGTLLDCAPNPTTGRFTVTYGTARAMDVTIELYDPAGHLVRTLVKAPRHAGPAVAEFDASGIPSGAYFVRMKTADGVRAQQIVVRH